MTNQELKVIITAFDNTKQAFQSVQQTFSSLAGSITATATKFSMITYAAEHAFSMVSSTIKTALQPMEDFNLSVTKMAAMITSMQNKGDLSTNYVKAKQYAEALYSTLEDIDRKTLASAQDLSLMTEEMGKQGLFLDINNQKQIDGFTNLANAVAVISAGSANREIQIRQEIGALLRGQLDMHSQLGKQLDAMVGGSLKQKLELWEKEGTVIEHIGELLKGYSAAAEDIQGSWAALGSTLETIKNRILREGFGEIYKDLNGQLKKMNDWLSTHANALGQAIKSLWTALKSVNDLLDTGISPLFDYLGKATWYTVEGWTIILATISLIAEKAKELKTTLTSLPKKAVEWGINVGRDMAGDAPVDFKNDKPKDTRIKAYESWLDELKAKIDEIHTTFSGKGPKQPKVTIPTFNQPKNAGDTTDAEEAANKRLQYLESEENAAQKAYEARMKLEHNLTEAQATELEKQLWAVDDWVKTQISLMEDAGLEAEQIENKMMNVTKIAVDQKKKIIKEQNKQLEPTTFTEGWTAGLKRYINDTGSMFNLAVDMARQTAQAMQSAFQTFFFDMFQGKITTMKQLLTGLAQFAAQVASNILASMATTKILSMIPASWGGAKTTTSTPAGGGGEVDFTNIKSLSKAKSGNEPVTVNIVNSGNTERPDVSYTRSDLEGLIIDVVYRNFNSNGPIRHLGAA